MSKLNIRNRKPQFPIEVTEAGYLAVDADGIVCVRAQAPLSLQVAWTPTDNVLSEQLGFVATADVGATTLTFSQTSIPQFDLRNTTILTALSFPNLTHIDVSNSQGEGGLVISGHPALTSLSLPLLISNGAGQKCQLNSNTALTSLSLPAFVTSNDFFECKGNTLLTTFSAPVWLPSIDAYSDFSANALSAASVNLILARHIAQEHWGEDAEELRLEGGTNAAPTGQGIADKAALTLRGATVTTN